MMNKKIVYAIIFVLIIIITSFFIINNWNKLFTNKVDVKYPDGCVETYINFKLVGDSCNYKEENDVINLNDSLFANWSYKKEAS